jgi:predicted ATP-binding protein involved in virulence
MTKRLLTALGLLGCLALPATAFGHPPSKADKKNAAKECRAERGTTDAEKEAFAQQYGTAKSNYKNAFGKCVSARARDEHAERHAAKRNASRDCRDERKADPEAFRLQYGTAKSHYKNAFGKCVSQKAKQKKAAADKRDREQIKSEHNAAKECADERSAIGEDAFAQNYGTSKSKHSNAFGKCVSQHVK